MIVDVIVGMQTKAFSSCFHRACAGQNITVFGFFGPVPEDSDVVFKDGKVPLTRLELCSNDGNYKCEDLAEVEVDAMFGTFTHSIPIDSDFIAHRGVGSYDIGGYHCPEDKPRCKREDEVSSGRTVIYILADIATGHNSITLEGPATVNPASDLHVWGTVQGPAGIPASGTRVALAWRRDGLGSGVTLLLTFWIHYHSFDGQAIAEHVCHPCECELTPPTQGMLLAQCLFHKQQCSSCSRPWHLIL
jgi:hypothetical protein